MLSNKTARLGAAGCSVRRGHNLSSGGFGLRRFRRRGAVMIMMPHGGGGGAEDSVTVMARRLGGGGRGGLSRSRGVKV